MWVKDGEPLTWDIPCVAVGWLERGHSYAVGDTPSAVKDRIAGMLQTFVWGSGAFGSHHCNLGLCGIRSQARSLLDGVPQFREPSAVRIQRSATELAEQKAMVKRTVARHMRRHPGASSPCTLEETHRSEGSGFTLKLWSAHVVDGFSTATSRAVAKATSLIDPHPYEQRWGSAQIKVGWTNLFIPGLTAVYIVPSMILHYILEHHYRPPDVFCDATLQCPPIGTRTYFEAFKSAFPHLSTEDFETWIDGQIEVVSWMRSPRE